MHYTGYIIKMNSIYGRHISMNTITNLYLNGYESSVDAFLKTNCNILRHIIILINPSKS